LEYRIGGSCVAVLGAGSASRLVSHAAVRNNVRSVAIPNECPVAVGGVPKAVEHSLEGDLFDLIILDEWLQLFPGLEVAIVEGPVMFMLEGRRKVRRRVQDVVIVVVKIGRLELRLFFGVGLRADD